MFTGLVQSLGQAAFVDAYHLRIRYLSPPSFAAAVEPGDSIAVDGICLTVEQHTATGFIAATSPETLQRTTLSQLESTGQDAIVNLEPSLRAGDKIGGHFVTGHIDGLGYLQEAAETPPFWTLSFQVSSESPVTRYLVLKGSIAINGVSLTIATCNERRTQFSIAVIPLTYEQTNLQYLRSGHPVNLEADILGKYVDQLLHHPQRSSAVPEPNLDLAFLQEHGYG
ncbi:MAG: riboflavin synthase [Prochlorotrichaceae cyanobacterium]|jgi:riboflavin synthase